MTRISFLLFPLVVAQCVTALAPPKTVKHPNFLQNLAAAAIIGTSVTAAALVVTPEPAHATYSAYTNREKDWQERQSKGEIKISSSRDLKAQLAAIAPANAQSQIFCPNGPSAAVTPLMENRCGDRMAIPSVYGRTEDAVGNSIPGFAGGLYLDNQSTSLAASANVGGFPSYK